MSKLSEPANLLPIGKVRLALYLPLYEKDPATGEIRSGAAEGAFLIEIARAIAVRVGVELQMEGYPTPREAVAALKTRECDLGFFGIDPVRAADVDFSPLAIAGQSAVSPCRARVRSSAAQACFLHS